MPCSLMARACSVELGPGRRRRVEAGLGQLGGVVVHHHELAVDRDADLGAVQLPEVDLLEDWLMSVPVAAMRSSSGSTLPVAMMLDGASSVRKMTSAAGWPAAAATWTSLNRTSIWALLDTSTVMPDSAWKASSRAWSGGTPQGGVRNVMVVPSWADADPAGTTRASVRSADGSDADARAMGHRLPPRDAWFGLRQ